MTYRRERIRPVPGHAATYGTTGGERRGYFIVGASSCVMCRCGWFSGGHFQRHGAQRAYRDHVKQALDAINQRIMAGEPTHPVEKTTEFLKNATRRVMDSLTPKERTIAVENAAKFIVDLERGERDPKEPTQ